MLYRPFSFFGVFVNLSIPQNKHIILIPIFLVPAFTLSFFGFFVHHTSTPPNKFVMVTANPPVERCAPFSGTAPIILLQLLNPQGLASTKRLFVSPEPPSLPPIRFLFVNRISALFPRPRTARLFAYLFFPPPPPTPTVHAPPFSISRFFIVPFAFPRRLKTIPLSFAFFF